MCLVLNATTNNETMQNFTRGTSETKTHAREKRETQEGGTKKTQQQKTEKTQTTEETKPLTNPAPAAKVKEDVKANATAH